jgi:hypothetical protein
MERNDFGGYLILGGLPPFCGGLRSSSISERNLLTPFFTAEKDRRSFEGRLSTIFCILVMGEIWKSTAQLMCCLLKYD